MTMYWNTLEAPRNDAPLRLDEAEALASEPDPLVPIRLPPVAVKSLRAEVRSFDPALDPETDTFRCAVLLLAALEVGQNLARLSRYTQYERGFVAQCARRLVDNGTWRGGETVSSWTDRGPAHQAFWKDVGVAEGKLQRRQCAENGFEWAPPGAWMKSFEYADENGTRDISVFYHLPTRSPSSEIIALQDELAGDEDEEPATGHAAPAPEPPVPTKARVAWRLARTYPLLSTKQRKKVRQASPAGAGARPFAELFPEANWLR